MPSVQPGGTQQQQRPNARARRPNKATPIRRGALLEALRQGASREVAAAVAGIDRTTLWRWTRYDPTFAEEVERADAEAEMAMVKVIHDANDWRASAWWLERRRPHEWGRNAHPVVDVRDLAARVAEAEGIDLDDLLRGAEEIQSKYGRPDSR
jgi:hypothetical protein